MKTFLFTATIACTSLFASTVSVVNHDDLTSHSMRNNKLVGLATMKSGSKEIEVWRSNVAVGSSTPVHSHDCEETFIFLKGKGKLIAGGKEYFWEAPCTVVIPAGVVHQYFNVGDEPTDGIVILSIGSKIFNVDGKVISHLPWRGEFLPPQDAHE